MKIIFFLLLSINIVSAACVEATFDLPADDTLLTEVLATTIQGDYSSAWGQRSVPGADSVEIANVTDKTYFVARRYNPATKETSEFSNELMFDLEPAPHTTLKVMWNYSDDTVDGFRFYLGDKIVAELLDSTARTFTILCTLYGDQEKIFTMTAFKAGQESIHSNSLPVMPVLPERYVFHMLPHHSRKTLCDAVQPSGNLCWACHQNY